MNSGERRIRSVAVKETPASLATENLQVLGAQGSALELCPGLFLGQGVYQAKGCSDFLFLISVHAESTFDHREH